MLFLCVRGSLYLLVVVVVVVVFYAICWRCPLPTKKVKQPLNGRKTHPCLLAACDALALQHKCRAVGFSVEEKVEYRLSLLSSVLACLLAVKMYF